MEKEDTPLKEGRREKGEKGKERREKGRREKGEGRRGEKGEGRRGRKEKGEGGEGSMWVVERKAIYNVHVVSSANIDQKGWTGQTDNEYILLLKKMTGRM